MEADRHDLSPRRPGTAFGTLARSVGVVAVLLAVGMVIFGGPVEAQIDLPPLTLPPPDTNTTRLLPPLPTDSLLAPGPGGEPAPALLPLPTVPPARRTTTYKPPPVPPSTPAQAQVVAKGSRATTTASAVPADQVEGAELGEADSGFGALPFDDETQATELSTVDDTMELGIRVSERHRIGSFASTAGGLVLMVLSGVMLWLRREIRRPAPVAPW